MLADKLFKLQEAMPASLRICLICLLGAMAALGQAPIGLPFLSLLGFTFAFLGFPRLKDARASFGFGWLFGFGYFLLTMQWIVSPFLVEPERHAWMAPFALIFMSAGLALFWGAAARLAFQFNRPLVFAFSLTLAELARGYIFTGFPWGMPAYGLVDRAFGQLAAWVGPYGLSLLFLLTAALLANAIDQRIRRGIAFSLAAPGVALLVLPAPEPAAAPASTPIVRLVQPNAAQHLKWDPAYVPIFFQRALSYTAQDAAQRPALIVWPETALPAPLNFADAELEAISKAALNVPVLVGANRFDGMRLHNAIVLLNELGASQTIYDKHHLVPFGEYMPLRNLMAKIGMFGLAAQAEQGFWPGPGPRLMDMGALGKALPMICYEAVFPQYARAGTARPDFLVQLTNDAWFGKFSGPYQHLVQAQMRAIETGLPMIRAANTGVSAMIDAQGRIAASLPLNEAGFIDVPLQSRIAKTAYAKTGDLPVFVICLLLFLGIWLKARRKSD